jgi:hypothetical protein
VVVARTKRLLVGFCAAALENDGDAKCHGLRVRSSIWRSLLV